MVITCAAKIDRSKYDILCFRLCTLTFAYFLINIYIFSLRAMTGPYDRDKNKTRRFKVLKLQKPQKPIRTTWILDNR